MFVIGILWNWQCVFLSSKILSLNDGRPNLYPSARAKPNMIPVSVVLSFLPEGKFTSISKIKSHKEVTFYFCLIIEVPLSVPHTYGSGRIQDAQKMRVLAFWKSNLDASVGSEIMGWKVISLTMSASCSAEANLVFFIAVVRRCLPG